MPPRKQAAPETSSRRKAASKARPTAALVTPLTGAAKPRRTRTPRPVDAATRLAIFRRLRDADPEPRGELEAVNPFTLLVAVVLSAQATDRSVNLATRELFKVADT